MLDRIRTRANDESGFTLVELLVVMLILGILAAIAIPSFFNQRDKANDADAKASVRTAQTAMETHATDNDGLYTGATVAILEGIEPTLADANLAPAPVVGANGDSYTISATSDTGTVFEIERLASGVTNYTCDAPGEGGCPTGGEWAGEAPAA